MNKHFFSKKLRIFFLVILPTFMFTAWDCDNEYGADLLDAPLGIVHNDYNYKVEVIETFTSPTANPRCMMYYSGHLYIYSHNGTSSPSILIWNTTSHSTTGAIATTCPSATGMGGGIYFTGSPSTIYITAGNSGVVYQLSYSGTTTGGNATTSSTISTGFTFNASSITRDSNYNYLMTDPDNDKLYSLDNSWAYNQYYSSSDRPSVIYYSSYNLWAIKKDRGTIQILSEYNDYEKTDEAALPDGSDCTGIAYDGSSYYWLADDANDKLYKVTIEYDYSYKK